jgi:hypothetical protein
MSRLAKLAALGLVTATLFVGSMAHAADVPISDEARNHFKAGVSLLQDPDGERIEDAYREFKAAYEISHSPKILGNMGLCAMKLERDGEAIEAYSQYLREVADIEPDERAQITRDLQTLGVGVVRVSMKIKAPPGVKVLLTDVRIPVRGERITNSYPVTGETVSLGIRSGRHVITVRAEGHLDEVWELDALAGSKESRDVVLKPKPVEAPPPPVKPTEPPRPVPEKSSSNVAPWVVAGVGGAMIVAGAVTGVVALGKQSDISSACPNDLCPSTFDLASARSSAKTMIGVTDVLLIGGAVVAAGGITWGLLSSSSESPRAARGRKMPDVSAFCGPTGCAASAKVSF